MVPTSRNPLSSLNDECFEIFVADGALMQKERSNKAVWNEARKKGCTTDLYFRYNADQPECFHVTRGAA
jgi:hypothetical protein